MKSVKVIFITVEICAICTVILLAFSESAVQNMGHFFHAAYISLLTLLAVTCQKEQQAIEWEEEEDVRSI
jgi:hypothetical protein